MAASSSPSCSISNTFSIHSPRFSISSSQFKPFNTLLLKSRSLNYVLNLHHIPVKFVSNVSHRHCRSRHGVFKAPFALKDSASYTSDEEATAQGDVEESERTSDQKDLFSLKSLITIYKEAILDGDEKVMSEVEAMICMVESEKDKLVEKVSALSAEINSGKEKYIRLQADFDNFRKRTEKAKLAIRSDAQGEVVESLLPIVDNFERAKQQIKLETEKETKIDASYQGIYKQLVEIMRSLRVSTVATIGKPFDPSLHEAIAREESQEFNEGIVIQEFRRGFLLDDRLLRPAMVKVSSGPGRIKKSVVSVAQAGQVEEAEVFTEPSAAASGIDEQ